MENVIFSMFCPIYSGGVMQCNRICHICLYITICQMSFFLLWRAFTLVVLYSIGFYCGGVYMICHIVNTKCKTSSKWKCFQNCWRLKTTCDSKRIANCRRFKTTGQYNVHKRTNASCHYSIVLYSLYVYAHFHCYNRIKCVYLYMYITICLLIQWPMIT